MGTASISTDVRHNAGEAARRLEGIPDRLLRATRDATSDATRIIERDAEEEMERIAGGVYWDIHRNFVSTPDGAQGAVTTPPSRPHEIEPHGPYPLRFRGRDGRWVSTYHVHHPGSKPVDWVGPISRRPHDDIKRAFFEGWKGAMRGDLRGGGAGGALPRAAF